MVAALEAAQAELSKHAAETGARLPQPRTSQPAASNRRKTNAA